MKEIDLKDKLTPLYYEMKRKEDAISMIERGIAILQDYYDVELNGKIELKPKSNS